MIKCARFWLSSLCNICPAESVDFCYFLYCVYYVSAVISMFVVSRSTACSAFTNFFRCISDCRYARSQLWVEMGFTKVRFCRNFNCSNKSFISFFYSQNTTKILVLHGGNYFLWKGDRSASFSRGSTTNSLAIFDVSISPNFQYKGHSDFSRQDVLSFHENSNKNAALIVFFTLVE